MNESKTLLEALLAFQKDAGEIELVKEATNPHFKSKYVRLAKLQEAVRPVLNKHGLVWTALPQIARDEQYVLRYYLRLASAPPEDPSLAGPREAITGDVPLIGATDMQKLGSAITYAQRQALGAVLGIAADEDDDAEATRPAKAKDPRDQAPVQALAEASQRSRKAPPRKPPMLSRAERTELATLLENAGITAAEAYEHANINPAEGVSMEQALKVRQLIESKK